MQEVTLGNRPTAMAPMTKIVDFQVETGYVRVCLKLSQPDPINLVISAQAFEVDDQGVNLVAPDGRPSRTGDTSHTLIASSLGDTHTLKPGWVKIMTTYIEADFDASVPRGEINPTLEPDWSNNPEGKFFNTATQTAWRWESTGEIMRIANGKVEEMMTIIRNSAPLSGLDF